MTWKDSIKIAPSILSANFAILGQEVEQVTADGADYIHIDVMDNHFVPNLTFGPDVVKAVRPYSNLVFDVHLMTSPVDSLVKPFATAGANIITAHVEAGPHLHRTLALIHDHGVKAGVALNPATPVSAIECIIDHVDLVLVMTINPGFGGQKLIPQTLTKIREIRRLIESTGRDIDLEVDGGIYPGTTAPQVIEAGTNVLVAGTAIFGRKAPDNYRSAIASLRTRSA